MKTPVNILRNQTFKVFHRLKSMLNLEGLVFYRLKSMLNLEGYGYSFLFFYTFILVLPFYPTSAQYLQINKKDGTKIKISTSFIDSVTFPSQHIYVYKKDNTYDKILKSAVDSLTHVMDTSSSGTITDIEGNVYNTVTIGTQVWMKENLKVTKYRNGDTIPTTTSTSIPNDSTSKYQWAYNNDNNNVAIYGRLYTWYAVTDSRNVCPAGWHVPSDAEWCTLENFVEINTDPTCNLTGYRGTNTGGKLKEAGTSHWNSPNIGADNSSGFTALPGGYRNNGGAFYFIGDDGSWWSATEYNATIAWTRYLNYSNPSAYRSNYFKHYGFSVRCLRD